MRNGRRLFRLEKIIYGRVEKLRGKRKIRRKQKKIKLKQLSWIDYTHSSDYGYFPILLESIQNYLAHRF